MNEKMLKALLDADAITGVQIVGQGSGFHVVIRTRTREHPLCRQRGGVRHWASLDAVARWVRNAGIGRADLSLVDWQPEQRDLRLESKPETKESRRSGFTTGLLDLR